MMVSTAFVLLCKWRMQQAKAVPAVKAVQDQEQEQEQQLEQHKEQELEQHVDDTWARYGVSPGDVLGAVHNHLAARTAEWVAALDAKAGQQVPAAPRSNISIATPAAASNSLTSSISSNANAPSAAPTEMVEAAAGGAAPITATAATAVAPVPPAPKVESATDAAATIQPAAAAAPQQRRSLMEAIRAMIESEPANQPAINTEPQSSAEPQRQCSLMEAIQAMVESEAAHQPAEPEAASQPAEPEGPQQQGFLVRAPSGIVVTAIMQNFEAIGKASKDTTAAAGNHRRSSSSSSGGGSSSASMQGVEAPSRVSDAGLSRQSSLSSTSSSFGPYISSTGPVLIGTSVGKHVESAGPLKRIRMFAMSWI